MNLLGFDFGTKRIGVAFGETIAGTTKALPTIPADNGTPNWSTVTGLVDEWQPEKIIVGLPLTHDGKKLRHLTAAAKAFAEKLQQHTNLPVTLHDESYSTVEARAQAFEIGGFKKLQKSEIDSHAACIILEDWIDHHA